jgi:predicted secreted hydrolase
MKKNTKNSIRNILLSICLITVLLFAGVGSTFACITSPSAFHPYAFLTNTPEYYAKFHILPNIILPYEDGLRTSSVSGDYEWWYFDAALSDGSMMVITFYDKDPQNPNVSGFQPFVTFDQVEPNGTTISGLAPYSANDFSASKLYCNVKMGPNTFVGDLHNYTIHVDLPVTEIVNGVSSVVNVTGDIALQGTTPPWRPDTGYIVFKDYTSEHYFAWLPAVPQGNVKCTLNIAGKTQTLTGIGYHDHNWGDYAISSLMDHWYWGRAIVGRYSAITADITASQYYNSSAIPIFMLANNGKIIADDGSKVTFTPSDIQTENGIPVANIVTYDYNNGEHQVIYSNPTVIAAEPFDSGVYLRFLGAATLMNGTTVVGPSPASWELMRLGS